jgi:hypothetical protein
MEEQQRCFNNLPTEALFSFFCTLEPNLLGKRYFLLEIAIEKIAQIKVIMGL